MMMVRVEKKVEQKKSIYGTAANDMKTGNKNQFIKEAQKSANKKNLRSEGEE